MKTSRLAVPAALIAAGSLAACVFVDIDDACLDDNSCVDGGAVPDGPSVDGPGADTNGDALPSPSDSGLDADAVSPIPRGPKDCDAGDGGVSHVFCADFDQPDAAYGWTSVDDDDGVVVSDVSFMGVAPSFPKALYVKAHLDAGGSDASVGLRKNFVTEWNLAPPTRRLAVHAWLQWEKGSASSTSACFFDALRIDLPPSCSFAVRWRGEFMFVGDDGGETRFDAGLFTRTWYLFDLDVDEVRHVVRVAVGDGDSALETEIPVACLGTGGGPRMLRVGLEPITNCTEDVRIFIDTVVIDF